MFRVCCFVGMLALATLFTTARSESPPVSAKVKTPFTDHIYKVIDFPGVNRDPQVTLEKVLEALSKQHRVTFDINDRAFKLEMLAGEALNTTVVAEAPLPPMKAPMVEVLQRILRRIPSPSGAVWLLRRDHIEITTAAQASAEIYNKGIPKINPLEETEIIHDARPLIQADFDKAPIAEVMHKVADRADCNIMLDGTLDKEKQQTLVSAKFRNVPRESAIMLLASQAGLVVVGIDNVYYVTTKERAKRLSKQHEALRATRLQK